MSAEILECDRTDPHFPHLWFGIIGNYACVGVRPVLVTGGSAPIPPDATAQNAPSRRDGEGDHR